MKLWLVSVFSLEFVLLIQFLQTKLQIIKLILRLFIHNFFDSLLFDFWFGTSNGAWLAEFFDAEFFFGDEFGLHRFILKSNFFVDFLTNLSLLSSTTGVDTVTDFDVVLRSKIMNIFDYFHMFI